MQVARKSSPVARYSRTPGSTPGASGLHFDLYSTAEALPDKDWSAVVDAGHVFLQPTYLRALERSRPERMTFFYALFREQGRPVAVASFQCVDFGMDGFGPNLLPEGVAPEEAAGTSFFVRAQLKRVLGRMRVRVLVCGNLFVCGPHGFAHRPELDAERAWSALAEAVDALQAQERNLTFVLVKDLAPGAHGATRALERAGLDKVRVEPTMVLTVRPTFVHLKEALGEDFDFVGYFEGEELRAFNTRLRAGDELESYYLGLDYAHNERLALYFNAMLDDVEHGILTGAHRLQLGRTSLERKSALGAEPVDLNLFTRHREPLLYPMARSLLSLVQPKWTARHPFKEHA